ncbi:hypothetical protein LCGC14_1500450 [marine sediment metagenome]|uniref:Uncharacterized protein n=1 Tax=marine sediment metagenome TaxID=412755 RepID=A0A0F9LJX6_9ZZZZ
MFEGMMYSVGSYAATVAIGYLLGWWRTNQVGKSLAVAFADGKITSDELKSGVKFIKTMINKIN